MHVLKIKMRILNLRSARVLFYISLIPVACVSVSAQVTLVLTSLPENTTSKDSIFVAGTFNNWNPSESRMIPDSDGNYIFTVPEGIGKVEFKFTRGSWNSVEGNEKGGLMPNRSFEFTGNPQTLYLTIASWEDLELSPTTAAWNVSVLKSDFDFPQLGKTRKIRLYLPPDYYTSDKTYPVLYMHDGQNLFDNATSFSGEWQVDETLNALFEAGDYGVIVVGIDNGDTNRINEYTPWKNPKYGGGQGDLYMEFIVETLKPYIDLNFRTRPEPEHSALIGSSLGGLISTYGAVKYPDKFGIIGAMSPSYWIVSDELDNYITTATTDLTDTIIYFLAGENESKTIVENIEFIKTSLTEKGLSEENIRIKIDSDGEHNEAYWSREFGRLYQWLFNGN